MMMIVGGLEGEEQKGVVSDCELGGMECEMKLNKVTQRMIVEFFVCSCNSFPSEDGKGGKSNENAMKFHYFVLDFVSLAVVCSNCFRRL